MAELKDPVTSKIPNSKVILEVDAFPFKGLIISEDWKTLESIEGRTNCSKCKKSRKYFCYSCYIAVPEIQHFVPKVKLPIKVDIIKHAREMDGKSTAVHAAVLAPEDVSIYTYPCMPDYDPRENVVLIYPNPEAVSVEAACEKFFSKVSPNGRDPKRLCTDGSRFVVHRAVFIDSTWNQSRGIFKDPRIKSLSSVVLKSRLSQFWRHQADSPRWYLATVEAVHQFLVELHAAQWKLDHKMTCSEDGRDDSIQTNQPLPVEERLSVKTDRGNTTEDEVQQSTKISGDLEKSTFQKTKYFYDGQFDNLLFFFRFMYSKIHTLYDHEQLKSYKRRLE